jgi:hypothetical protein
MSTSRNGPALFGAFGAGFQWDALQARGVCACFLHFNRDDFSMNTLLKDVCSDTRVGATLLKSDRACAKLRTEGLIQ